MFQKHQLVGNMVSLTICYPLLLESQTFGVGDGLTE
jgi:hypothetical protein